MRNSPRSSGFADVVIGMEWGDEGKGRFVDGLAEHYDIVARYNGGPNAGHSVQVKDKSIALHQIPSGVAYPGKKLYIAAGCVVSFEELVKERAEIEQQGEEVMSRLRISGQAPVIQPHHVLLDNATMGEIGTTNKGIGPAYGDVRYRRFQDQQLDIRLGELKENTEWAFEMIRRNLQMMIARLPEMVPDENRRSQLLQAFDVDNRMTAMRQAFEQFRNCIDTDPITLLKAIRSGLRVLFEGAQSEGLSIQNGQTPFVTASYPGVQGALQSGNVPPEFLRYAYGVAKAIPSRVGFGPFVGELGGKESEEHCMAEGGKKHTKDVEEQLFGPHVKQMLASGDPLQKGIAIRLLTNEYGVTSKRPRRLGMTDFVHLRVVAEINGLRGIFLTKLDCLNNHGLDGQGIPYVREYELDGQRIDYVPTSATALRRAKPVIERSTPFAEDISNERDFMKLPWQAQQYVSRDFQQSANLEVLQVGVGPKRDQVISTNGWRPDKQ